jgi:putative hydrolase of the HAD superfamily
MNSVHLRLYAPGLPMYIGIHRDHKNGPPMKVRKLLICDSEACMVLIQRVYDWRAMERIEAIVFDWGGVLIDNPAPGLMAYCAEALAVSVVDYQQAHNRHGEPFQKGLVPESAFWQRVCTDLKRPMPNVASLWGQAFRAVYSPKREVFDWAGQLRKQGYKTALLSNTEQPAMEFFLELRYHVFDAAIFSCNEGTLKPERKIYETAARRLGVSPSRCAFIDDKQLFVDGAIRAGMRAVLYEDLGQVKRVLAPLGVSSGI